MSAVTTPERGTGACGFGEAYESFKRDLIEWTGLAYYRHRDELLIDVLRRRLAATGLSSLSDYRSLLFDRRGESEEFNELVNRLTVGETYFFRCPEQFDLLRKTVIPECLARRRSEKVLRIWSAGCASGPEAYSLAILLRREFGTMLRGWRIHLLATDVNAAFLRQAEQARFGDWHLRTLTDAERAEYFHREGKQWIVKERYQGLIEFELHNLVSDPFPALARSIHDFDIILCRNVLIYFDTRVAEDLLPRFENSLTPGGWLLLGPSDPVYLAARCLRPAGPADAFAYRREAPGMARQHWPPAPVDPLALLPPHAALRAVASQLRKAERMPLAPPDARGRASGVADPSPTPEQVRRLVDRGCWEEAGQACERLLAACAEDPESQLLHGLILEHGGDTDNAELAFKRAAYLDRHHALAWYHLGRMQARNGHRRRALSSFRSATQAIDDAGAREWSSEVPPERLRRMAELQIEMRS